ncbi:MAG: MBL fold metallo-hydrolase [Desulfovibrio sp.]|nr:MBL fold metallo-hydrolase [Desulfovibrio sp.]
MLMCLPLRGYFVVNAYLYVDDQSHKGFLLDPGAEYAKVLNLLKEKDIVLERILLTHGHFDHTGAAHALHSTLQVPIAMAQEGRRYAEDPFWNLSLACGEEVILPEVEYFKSADHPEFVAGNLHLKVRAVPGHTPDSVLYYDEEASLAFVGDTIFRGSPGSTQFYGGNARDLAKSIVREIATLPEETVLLSGHSEPTTVREEKQQAYFKNLLHHWN